MRKILIDTDIGIDCDDAMALALAISLEKQKLIEIVGVTACTSREGATQAISAIFDYYDAKTQVGRYTGEPFECDKSNVYAKAVQERFGGKESYEDAIKFLRRKIASSLTKITLVAIGPLTNIAKLLSSDGDEISPLNGVQLVKKGVDTIYSMAGNFLHINLGEPFGIAEWNAVQDIDACKTLVRKCPVEIVFSPYEIGYEVLSGKTFGKNDPVGYSIKKFFDVNTSEFSGEYIRCSWDPITVAVASGVDICEFSPYGKVTVDDEGVMFFKKGKGLHRYLLKKNSSEVVAEQLEKIYEKVIKE